MAVESVKTIYFLWEPLVLRMEMAKSMSKYKIKLRISMTPRDSSSNKLRIFCKSVKDLVYFNCLKMIELSILVSACLHSLVIFSFLESYSLLTQYVLLKHNFLCIRKLRIKNLMHLLSQVKNKDLMSYKKVPIHQRKYSQA